MLALSLFGVNWVPQRVVDLLACWKGRFNRQLECSPTLCNVDCLKGKEWPDIEQTMLAVKLVILQTLYE